MPDGRPKCAGQGSTGIVAVEDPLDLPAELRFDGATFGLCRRIGGGPDCAWFGSFSLLARSLGDVVVIDHCSLSRFSQMQEN